MANELIQGFVGFLAIIFCIIVYIVILNILKFIISINFISKLVKDFKKSHDKYIKGEEYKGWKPWGYK